MTNESDSGGTTDVGSSHPRPTSFGGETHHFEPPRTPDVATLSRTRPCCRPRLQPTVTVTLESPNPAADELFAHVYESLKGLAHRVRSGRSGDMLNTTALVHEAFVKLTASGPPAWKNEAHFFAVAARAMRQILVDAARRDLARKRGANRSSCRTTTPPTRGAVRVDARARRCARVGTRLRVRLVSRYTRYLAERAARHAVALDSGLAESHLSLGIIHTFHTWDWAEADRETARAVALGLIFLAAEPMYDSLRGEPRYRRVVEHIGLVER